MGSAKDRQISPADRRGGPSASGPRDMWELFQPSTVRPVLCLGRHRCCPRDVPCKPVGSLGTADGSQTGLSMPKQREAMFLADRRPKEAMIKQAFCRSVAQASTVGRGGGRCTSTHAPGTGSDGQ